MTYDNNVATFIRGLEETEGPMVLLKKHLLGAAFQIAALRDALAISWSGIYPAVCHLIIAFDRPLACSLGQAHAV